MNDRQLCGVINKYKSYKNQAKELIEKAWSIHEKITELQKSKYSGEIPDYYYQDIVKYIPKTLQNVKKSLVESFNDSIIKDEVFLKDLNLNSIKTEGILSSLNQMITACDVIIGTLEKDISALSTKEQKKQEELRKEVTETCEKLEPLIEENLIEALDELESGHFLASALITSRIIDYTLTQLKIQEDKKQIKSIIKKATDEKNDTILKQQTETISRLSRNLYTHRIDRFAKFSQASTLLNDCLFLLDIYSKSKGDDDDFKT